MGSREGYNNKGKRRVLMEGRERAPVGGQRWKKVSVDLPGGARGERFEGKAAENRGNVDHPENACGLPRDRLEMSPVSLGIVAFSNFSSSRSLVLCVRSPPSPFVFLPTSSVLSHFTTSSVFRSFARTEISCFDGGYKVYR